MSDNGTRRFDDRLYIPVAKLPGSAKILSIIMLLIGSKITIYHRATNNDAMKEIMPPFPKSAIEEFCPSVKSVLSRGQGYYVLTGGDPEAHKDVLKWILQACSSTEGTKLHFRTIDDSENPFSYYPEVMKSAERLGIKGFAAGLQKRLMAYSRKNLMDVDTMYEYYDVDSLTEEKLNLREVVVESVFQAWYDPKKEGRWNDDIDAEVGDLRHAYPAFGDSLDERVEKQKQDREAYLAGKKAEKEGLTNNSAGAGWDNDNGGAETSTTAGAGWDNDNNGSTDVSTPASADWDSGADTVVPGTSWADEVTQVAQESSTKW